MKKKVIIIVSASVVALAAIAVAVFFIIKGSTFKTTESAVYVKKNGKIVEAGIEAFDTSVYNAEQLEAFIDQEVSKYNATVKDKRIKFKELEVEENVATMILEYETYEDFQAFHGVTFFAGTLDDAVKKGYLEGLEFYSVYDEAVGEAVPLSEVKGEELKVVVLEERMGICVKGTISYISKNLKLVDKDTVTPDKTVQDVEDYIIVIYE